MCIFGQFLQGKYKQEKVILLRFSVQLADGYHQTRFEKNVLVTVFRCFYPTLRSQFLYFNRQANGITSLGGSRGRGAGGGESKFE